MITVPYVRDVMSRSVAQIAPSAPLSQIHYFFSDPDQQYLLIVEQYRPVGIISALHMQRVARVTGFPFKTMAATRGENMTAADLMTVTTSVIDADASILEAATLLISLPLDALPVVADGRVVGLLSEQQLSRAMVQYARSMSRLYHLDLDTTAVYA